MEWIKTYRKSGNYDTAIMASRELLLKFKTAIIYNEAAKRKIAAMEASNIETVAVAAKKKRHEVEKRLKHFYEWEKTVSDLCKEIETEKAVKKEKEARLREKNRYSDMEKEVKRYVAEKDYVKAIQHARAFVSMFEGDSGALKLLAKVQRLNEKQKTKAERKAEQEKRIRKIFEEVGAEIRPKWETVEKNVGFLTQLRAKFVQYSAQAAERRQYLKDQKALKSVEELLAKGGIYKISGADGERLMDDVKSGVVRAVSGFKLPGFDFYGQIIGKDRIVGDTFGSYSEGSRTVFYFGDATGHGIQAGFTVAELSKLFYEYAKKIRNFPELVMTINNQLKERLQGKVFVTAVFFEYDANVGKLRFIGGGHDPIFLYRSTTKEIEKIVPGGLAMGVRITKNVGSIKVRDLDMGHRDVLFGYTDGIIEARDLSGQLFGIPRLQETFSVGAKTVGPDPQKLFQFVLDETKKFAPVFEDDVSGFVWVRNTDKDIVVSRDQFEEILNEVGVKEKEARMGKFKNKNRGEVLEMLKAERREAELRRRLAYLDSLYKMGEFLKLKQKIQENVREGFVHEKMTKYLEKVMQNEDKIKMTKLEEKLRHKYETLVELQKKGQNEIVIREIVDIITRSGKL